MVWAELLHGPEFMEFLRTHYECTDVLFRLAEQSGIVLMPGGGFGGPEWSVRVSLANLPEETCPKIGELLKAAAEAYVTTMTEPEAREIFAAGSSGVRLRVDRAHHGIRHRPHFGMSPESGGDRRPCCRRPLQVLRRPALHRRSNCRCGAPTRCGTTSRAAALRIAAAASRASESRTRWPATRPRMGARRTVASSCAFATTERR